MPPAKIFLYLGLLLFCTNPTPSNSAVCSIDLGSEWMKIVVMNVKPGQSPISIAALMPFHSAVFVKEEDVATFTIKAVDDPRTLNKVMYMRPPGNMYSLNELVELWEKKVGKSLEKFYIPEEQVLQSIQAWDWNSYINHKKYKRSPVVDTKHKSVGNFFYVP
ncbi:hypothetical protein AMTR_s00011p00231600 [Amborella trichopoda]|uniref:NmrA-like domain-containing protein n=1 Tax=Amborella trichopoda TaxID=13333 RepID=W1NFZ0_AMBTC|nr:hypothetical protein AMTR_s00011p00231600 [Amborella trichopoda]